uniref:RRM domain-containing protein n=1 Tax=Euplotes harpa TaxID=151035 RepID=A0A7S3JCN3_9SPIT|mmetsp:Transcript_33090/g.37990  ORF Transcript_33090/g.37990 Transcript_33090/m.37990 type:complete len:424 (+) Transcript_33090:1324-2595(+)
MKRNFDEETNWNYLFMNQDAVTEAIANKLNLKKGDILNKEDDNLAVRVTNIETQIIKETKEWMLENGIDIKSIEGKNNRKDCKRSKKIILIKNISAKVTVDELKELFGRYGHIENLVISPSNTLGIVFFASESHSETAMKKLCYYRLHNIPLYLEYAPQFFEKTSAKRTAAEAEVVDNEEVENDLIKKYGNTVFVKNLNFDTTEEKLRKTFEGAKAGKILSCKIVKSKENGLQSSGYGFVEFENEEDTKKAIKKLQGVIVDEHVLKLKISRKDKYEAERKKRLEKLKRKEKTEESFVDNDDMASNKLLIKNLAFEANNKDIQALFKEVGQIKKIRLPKKANSHLHRGFGFIEFVTVEDARNAFETMQHSHLYGRKLVIQWAKKADDINDIMNLRQKARVQQEALKQGNNKKHKITEEVQSDQE